jgi:hypothetical protein
VIEQPDSGAEIAILAGGCVHHREELPANRARRHQRPYDLTVPPEEGRGCLAHVGPAPGQGMSRALEQEIGNPRERGRNHDQRTLMFRDQRRRLLDLVGRCE